MKVVRLGFHQATLRLSINCGWTGRWPGPDDAGADDETVGGTAADGGAERD